MKRSASEIYGSLLIYIADRVYDSLYLPSCMADFWHHLKRMLNCIRIHGDYRNSGQ